MSESTILNVTRAWCSRCSMEHPAHIIERQGEIFFEYICREKPHSRLVSHNAHIFRSLRSRISYTHFEQPPQSRYSWANRLNLTRDCNLVCPVCYESAGLEQGTHVNTEALLDTARKLRQLQRKNISFFGGEPVLHPDIDTLVHAVAKMGFKIDLQTNGLAFASDPGLARRLKDTGLSQIYLQWDSLAPHIISTMRGRDILAEKRQALHSMIGTGLYIGINAVVIPQNLQELGEFSRYFISFAPHVKVINFIVAAKEAGRYTLEKDYFLDREHIIESLIQGLAIPGLKLEHFFPYPWYDPLRLHIHPDCGALLALAILKGQAQPLDLYIDIQKCYALMEATPKGDPGIIDFKKADRILAVYLFRSIRKGKFWKVMRMLWGYIFKTGKDSVLIIAIEQFLRPDYRDMQRLDFCSANHVSSKGEMLSCCQYYQPKTNV